MKAQAIYDITMSLIDERKNDGTVNTAQTKDYKARTPGILTNLQSDISMKLRLAGAEVSSLDEVKTLNSDIDLSDDICTAIIPNGLAGRLLITEDPNLSNYFSSTYNSQLNDYTKLYRTPAKFGIIEDVYKSSMRVGD